MNDDDKKLFFRSLIRSFSNDSAARQAGGAATAVSSEADAGDPQKDYSYNFEFLSILEPDGEPTFQIERVFSVSNRQEQIKPDPIHPSDDPWVWSLFFKTSGEAGKITVTTKIKIKNSGEEIIEVVTREIGIPLNQSSNAAVILPPPRLIKAINSTTVREPSAVNNPPDGAAVKAILDHIWKRLERGVGPAWVGPHTDKQGQSQKHGQQERFGLSPLLDGSDKAALLDFMTPTELEESWAQLTAELLTCSPYARPVTAYSTSDGKGTISEDSIFVKMQDANDPAHPIVAECQHLCTMAAIWRGFPVNIPFDVKDNKTGAQKKVTAPPFTAGNSAASVNKHEGGMWLDKAPYDARPRTNPPEQPPVNGVPKAILDGYGVGSVYAYQGGYQVLDEKGKPVFDKKGDPVVVYGDNIGSAHIGFTLRIHPDRLRMQFFDTGGMNSPDESNTRPMKGGKGVYEYEWTNFVSGPTGIHKFVGIGVMPPPRDLKGAIAHMLRSRPLGLARLALINRSDKTLLYASPLLLTYGPSSSQNFSYSRYLWSLRNHPAYKTVEAVWMFDSPRGSLARAMIAGPRQKTLGELISTASGKVVPPEAPLPLGQSLSLTNFASTNDGKVEIHGVFDQHPGGNQVIPHPAQVNNIAWGKSSGALAASLPADIPGYFKGE